MSSLLIWTWLVPLAAAALAPSGRFWWIPAVAPLPAVASAVLLRAGVQIEIPWLLLGSVLGLDDASRIFLAFTSVLWLAAGIYASGSMRTDPYAGRFRTFFLLAMAGNLWLLVARDLVSFYTGFSLMGLASYGLVVHNGDRSALRAGKVYLVMTLAGELALFAALILVAAHVGGLVPDRSALVGLDDLTVGLLLTGLAIKAGLVPVHVWLPLAHPAAPVPASAVLSGAMIKVALLGWLRFLPIGEEPLTGWGFLLVFGGLATLFYAVPIGLLQSNPKVILAYSSVGKMGLMALTLGLILLEPVLAPAGVLALSLYAAHHALVKGGLFLGVGLRHHGGLQAIVLAGIVLLALSLAGFPPSSGAVAKYGIKPALASTDWYWLTTAVNLSAVATALLMARFLWVIWNTEPHPARGYVLAGLAWGALVGLSLIFPLTVGSTEARATNTVLMGITLVLVFPFVVVAVRKPGLLRPAQDLVPPGDLLGVLRPLLAAVRFLLRDVGRWFRRLLDASAAGLRTAVAALGPAPEDPERGLRRWPNAGGAWLGITALLFLPALWTLSDPTEVRTPRVAAEVPRDLLPGTEGDAIVTGPADAPPQAGEGSAARVSPDSAGAAAPAPGKADDVTTGSGAGRQARMPEPGSGAAEETPETRVAATSGERLAAEDVGMAVDVTPGVRAAQGPPLRDSAPAATSQPAAPSVPQTAVTAGADASSDSEPRASAAGGDLPGRASREGDLPSARVQTGGAGAGELEPAPALCSTNDIFVFAHPRVTKPLRLRTCERGPDGPVPLSAPTLTSSLVVLVQRHLNDLGYDAGPVDGIMGPMTRGAIRRFQRDQGVAETGDIGFALLEQIRSRTTR